MTSQEIYHFTIITQCFS